MPGLFVKKNEKVKSVFSGSIAKYMKALSRKTDATSRCSSAEFRALELLLCDEKDSRSLFIHQCFSATPCDASHLAVLLDLITESATIRQATLADSQWWTDFLNSTILSKNFSKRQVKLRTSIHSMVCEALSVWRFKFESLYHLIQSAISRSEIAGFKIADIAKDLAAKNAQEADAAGIQRQLMDLEISRTFPAIRSCANRIENAMNILFPQTLEEAFAGVAFASSVGSASIADSVSIKLGNSETESNRVIFDQLREDFRVFRKSYSAKLSQWSEVSLEISNFRKWFSLIEGRVVLLLGSKATLIPSGVDEDYIDDF